MELNRGNLFVTHHHILQVFFKGFGLETQNYLNSYDVDIVKSQRVRTIEFNKATVRLSRKRYSEHLTRRSFTAKSGSLSDNLWREGFFKSQRTGF